MSWPMMRRIFAEDLRIRERVEEHHRDYRDRHTAAIALEIKAFEEWQHRKDVLEDARIRVKVNTALANLRP